jgi:formylmethanofuran dehydrogenase subunit D
MDINRDGTITLGELGTEVSNTMLHIEGQQSDFYSSGTDNDLVICKTDKRLNSSKDLKFPLGSYVRVKNQFGRVVAASEKEPKEYDVVFFTYAQKKLEDTTNQRCGPHKEDLSNAPWNSNQTAA